MKTKRIKAESIDLHDDYDMGARPREGYFILKAAVPALQAQFVRDILLAGTPSVRLAIAQAFKRAGIVAAKGKST